MSSCRCGSRVMAQRIRLSRARGYRLPEGAINCARPGKLGNPFVVGRDGTRAECVGLYALAVGGIFALTGPSFDAQRAAAKAAWAGREQYAGRDVACWCALDGKPCHGDVLLALWNEPIRKGMLDRFVVQMPVQL